MKCIGAGLLEESNGNDAADASVLIKAGDKWALAATRRRCMSGAAPGHAFNVVNPNGVIRFLDGQLGGAAVPDGYSAYFRTN